MWKTLAVLCAVVIARGDEGEWREVKTPQGSVRGRRDPSGVYVFSNIPYATAPKGAYKFSAPLPPPAWLQPLEITEKTIICPQMTAHPLFDVSTKIMQEDCLTANVYAPVTDKKQLPVVVYVHGGAFEIGFGDMRTPKNLVKEHNVIVVTFNYRLHIHGFLCLGTEAIPGNAGLKDQVALLRWVQRNIASYGGDPDNVTLAGYSAGSISIDSLMLSSAAKGLFHKVILESGASVGYVALQRDPLENAKSYARKLNFTDVDDIYALEQFYKTTPLEKLIDSSSFLSRIPASSINMPCVGQRDDAILTDSPVNLIKHKKYNKIPILIGTANKEGLMLLHQFENWKELMNDKFADFLPTDLHFKNEEEKENVVKLIKEFYFGGKPVSEDTILGYIDYLSDIMFIYPTLRSAKMYRESGHEQVYLYEYSFVDNSNAPIPFTNVRGAGHCAQTGAITDGTGIEASYDESNISEEYKEVKKTMRQIWYNFVAHGKPIPDGSEFPAWPPVGADRSPHMSLGKTLELRGPLQQDRAEFWDAIYEKYYVHPVPPPKPPHTEL